MQNRIFKTLLRNLPVWMAETIENRVKERYPERNKVYYWLSQQPMDRWPVDTLKVFGEILGMDPITIYSTEILGVKIVPKTKPELYRLVATGGGKYLGASSIAFAQDGTVVSVADLDTTSPAALEAVRFIHE